MGYVVGQRRLIEIPIASRWELFYTEHTPKGRREEALGLWAAASSRLFSSAPPMNVQQHYLQIDVNL